MHFKCCIMLRTYVVIQCLIGTQFFVTDVAHFLPSHHIVHSLDVLNQVTSCAECLVALHTKKVLLFPVNTLRMII